MKWILLIFVFTSAAQACERLDAPARERLEQHRAVLVKSATAHGVPESLAIAVAQHESCFRVKAVSHGGAMGLMQIRMPTFKAFGDGDIFEPLSNASAGNRYLRHLYDRFGSWDLALAAYNAGPSRVTAADGVPSLPETRRYVRFVLATAYGLELELRHE